nr:transposase [Pseudomonas asiatica]
MLAQLKAGSKKTQPQVANQNELGKAICSLVSDWSSLERYVDHCCLPIDDNAAEGAIRPFVIGREN